MKYPSEKKHESKINQTLINILSKKVLKVVTNTTV